MGSKTMGEDGKKGQKTVQDGKPLVQEWQAMELPLGRERRGSLFWGWGPGEAVPPESNEAQFWGKERREVPFFPRT